MPRWGLADRVVQPGPVEVAAPSQPRLSVPTVRAVLFATVLALGGAAVVYAMRYALLIFNRNTLLNSWVAAVGLWLGVLASIAALTAMAACFGVLTQWLIGRRAAAFTHRGLPDHRSTRQLWAGCLLPLANLLWAPVYVIELARVEDHYQRLQKSIVVWWITWVVSNAVSLFAIATSFSSDAQGIANNTAMMVVAYAFAAGTVGAAAKVLEGFERKPVERPAHRWLVVPPEHSERPAAAPCADDAEGPEGQESAA
ncbi:hypothetical protein MB901379_04837 [Mycobacterium basiliense]|uniref:DUF4328 domain-containing protein n=2 Tax=Mycobacterium basiliense TaxID=2094119 RepID=A0A447GL49_9MYCO|nr:DUF4328 domain-containing protein [Mycobacterium basiliense]VDM91220.1 hypothetical protein MB901379_04837 [Mycobacterium basiliense]